jgi:hypothetical protein
MSKATKKAIEDFMRGMLADRLAQCTPEQRAFFNDRIYPKGVRTDRLEDAIDLCDRTIAKNKEA